MNVFDIIPQDVLNVIISKLDYKAMISLYKVSCKFSQHNFCSVLRQILSQMTKLKVEHYNKQQLWYLCNVLDKPYNRYLSNNEYSLILNGSGELIIPNLYEFFEMRDINILDRNIPIRIPKFDNKIVQAVAGVPQSLILLDNGQVYSFLNLHTDHLDELKVDEHIIFNTLSIIEGLDDIVQVAAGLNFSLALNNNGKVFYIKNENKSVNIIDGKVFYIKNEKQSVNIINVPATIVQISATSEHSLLLTANDQVYAFGNNSCGQLGIGDLIIPHIDNPILIPKLSNIIQISAGGNYSLVLNNKGEVYVFGHITYELCGRPQSTKLANIKQISVGFYYDTSLMLMNCGTIYAPNCSEDDNWNFEVICIDHTLNIIEVTSGIYDSLMLSNKGKIYKYDGINDIHTFYMGIQL